MITGTGTIFFKEYVVVPCENNHVVSKASIWVKKKKKYNRAIILIIDLGAAVFA